MASLSETFNKIVRIETKPREEAVQEHLDRLHVIEQSMYELAKEQQEGNTTLENLIQFSDLYSQHIDEMVGAYELPRTAVLFNRVQVPLPSKKTY